MALHTNYLPLTIEELPALAQKMSDEGWRFVQLLGVTTEEGIDLVYSFMKGDTLDNYKILGVKKGTKVPSISNVFFSAFVFENETHDLFGVEITDIVIDFGGNFYITACKEPMTIISPAQKEAREKARKIAAAKAAKAEGAAKGEGGSATIDEDKLAGMDPEKAAKVRAAMEAKAKKEAAAKAAAADEKIASLDPEKAAKVRAAMEAKAAREAAKAQAEDAGKDGE